MRNLEEYRLGERISMGTADYFIIIWILLKMGTNCSYFRDKVVTSKKKDTDTLPTMAGCLFT